MGVWGGESIGSLQVQLGKSLPVVDLLRTLKNMNDATFDDKKQVFQHTARPWALNISEMRGQHINSTLTKLHRTDRCSCNVIHYISCILTAKRSCDQAGEGEQPTGISLCAVICLADAKICP